jgi:glycosyltransferase involved in cell wall biosynthesis
LPNVPRLPCSSSTAINVIFVGRFFAQKGLEDLVQAWRKVRSRATFPTRLRLIGNGPLENELRALVKALDLGESVEFCGYCGDVPAELDKADLFVLPSYSEGNSNAILEAMRAGLPIVATRIGGAPIQVGSEGERFLVPAGAPDALADRLLELIEDEALRLRMGAAMRVRIENIFSIDKVAAIYEQAYELILAGHREQIGQINAALFSQSETENSKCAG